MWKYITIFAYIGLAFGAFVFYKNFDAMVFLSAPIKQNPMRDITMYAIPRYFQASILILRIFRQLQGQFIHSVFSFI